MISITRLIPAIAIVALVSGCPKPAPVANEGGSSSNPEQLAQEVTRLAAAGDSVAIGTKLQSACSDAQTRESCLQAQLVPLASSGKVRLAMGALVKLASLDPNIQTDGHVYAHAIGIAAGQSTGDVAGAFTQCSESFQSGCYHGVIQAWFGRLDSVGAKEINDLCQPFRADESQRWIRFQCVHGMGHGLTMLYKHDLRDGLKGCDLLSDSWDRHACYGGAFMENIVNVTNPHHPAAALAHDHQSASPKTDAASEHAGHDMAAMTAEKSKFKAVDPKDQLYPCSILGEQYQSDCYGMQTSVMLYNNGGNIADAAKSCDGAPRSMRTTCYASLGRDISSYAHQVHAEAIRMCSLGSKLYQPWCFLGVVKNLIDLNARASDGLAFCRSVQGDGNKQLCYAAVGEQILVLTPDIERRRQMCADSEQAYLVACHYGASVSRDLPDGLGKVYKSIE